MTQPGQILLEQPRQALAQLDHAMGTAQWAARGEAGLLRIGYTGSAPIHASFSKICRFSQAYPEIGLELLHASTSQQAEMLTVGSISESCDRLRYFRPQQHDHSSDLARPAGALCAERSSLAV
ncbi:hypothetical protein ACE10Z_33890 [Bradyrhizobium sp. Pha-3]|uniref:hypothetical protein n=1 Tax=Bradyrhizobium sp. Pha-3 TaxID=208375 RepID=UPI0035D42927